MISQHQMPADPKPERLDEPQVRAIQTKINNKLKPAKPVRTRTPSRAVPCGPTPQHAPRADSPTITSLMPNNLPAPKLSTLHVQINDMPQSEPAGQEQMASVQQAHRLWAVSLAPAPPHESTCQAHPYRVL